MTTLIFSDTHLTDKFEPDKFNKLKEVIKQADRVIINGDFFDGHLVDFDDFCRSQWKKLFPLLKQKKAVYVLGNHDEKELLDERVKLFSDKVLDNFEFVSKGKKFIVEHGHHLAPSLEFKLGFIKKLRNLNFSKAIYKGYVDFKVFAIKLVGNQYHNYFNRLETEQIKRWAKKNLKANEYLIAGHTHYQTFDPKLRFIGAGMINYGFCQCVVIDSGKIKIINERY